MSIWLTEEVHIRFWQISLGPECFNKQLVFFKQSNFQEDKDNPGKHLAPFSLLFSSHFVFLSKNGERPDRFWTFLCAFSDIGAKNKVKAFKLCLYLKNEWFLRAHSSSSQIGFDFILWNWRRNNLFPRRRSYTPVLPQDYLTLFGGKDANSICCILQEISITLHYGYRMRVIRRCEEE